MWETEGVKAMGTYWRGAKKKKHMCGAPFLHKHMRTVGGSRVLYLTWKDG